MWVKRKLEVYDCIYFFFFGLLDLLDSLGFFRDLCNPGDNLFVEHLVVLVPEQEKLLNTHHS